MTDKVKLKLNAALRGWPAGATINVTLDRYWRRRLEDAKTDSCVEIVKAPKAPKKVRKNEQES